jgi:hypothetical protein
MKFYRSLLDASSPRSSDDVQTVDDPSHDQNENKSSSSEDQFQQQSQSRKLIKLLCENFNKLMIRSIPYSTNTKVDAF